MAVLAGKVDPNLVSALGLLLFIGGAWALLVGRSWLGRATGLSLAVAMLPFALGFGYILAACSARNVCRNPDLSWIKLIETLSHVALALATISIALGVVRNLRRRLQA